MIVASIHKECRLIFNDLHSIGVMFIMPLIFMVIMTFALSSNEKDITASVKLYIDMPTNKGGETLFSGYLADFGYQFSERKEADIHISFHREFEQTLFQNENEHVVEPAITAKETTLITPQLKSILDQHLQMSLARTKLHLFMIDNDELDDSQPIEEQKAVIFKQTNNAELIKFGETQTTRSVTNHSIPAWLVFGIYFIVLPLSITLVNEHKSGTLMRIKTFPISNHHYFTAKVISFLAISLLQTIVLATIGFKFIPLLINESSTSWYTLVSMLPHALCVCLSAVAFGSLIATQITSYEHAIVFGGGVNIILAALSGLMVPLDIMPEQMQTVARLSPMFWASSGFSEIHLMHATNGYSTLLPLILFSSCCILIALLLFNRKIRKLVWN